MKWSWSNGTTCERSPRKNMINTNDNIQYTQEVPKEIVENTAYLQSLNCGDNLEGFHESNKREDSYNRMAEREMITQIGQNPFNTTSDYVNNVSIQDKFLKPINTISIDKSKPNNIGEQVNTSLNLEK